MIKLLLGTLAGLLLGVGGTFAYNHFLGAGPELAQAETKLAATGTDLSQTSQANTALKDENETLSAHVKELASRNEELQGQVEQLKKAVPAPAANPMAGIMKAQFQQQYQQKLALLKSRLNLTPDQEAALKAAMDREQKNMEEMTSQIMQGGKPVPPATHEKSADDILKDILTPDQKTAYQQMKTDEKTSQAESLANFEMNQAAPLLQLTDAQKDQVYSALYQLRLDAADPEKRKNPPADPNNPTAYLEAQNQAKEEALSKILSPGQLAQYHQQLQAQLETQKAVMQRFTPAATPNP